MCLGLVLESSAFEVGGDVGDGVLDELDLVGDGAAVGDRGGGFGLAVAVAVGGCGGGGGGGSGVFGVETLDFLLGLGDVLERDS